MNEPIMKLVFVLAGDRPEKGRDDVRNPTFPHLDHSHTTSKLTLGGTRLNPAYSFRLFHHQAEMRPPLIKTLR